VPVGITGLVCVEGAVRKTSVSSVHLLLEALLETRSAGRVRCAVVMLHSEQVGRQDKIVPRVLRYGSRGEGVLLSPEP
jgi:acyl-CoA hydrolase